MGKLYGGFTLNTQLHSQIHFSPFFIAKAIDSLKYLIYIIPNVGNT